MQVFSKPAPYLNSRLLRRTRLQRRINPAYHAGSMNLRRLFASCAAVTLLSVSSLAVACDLSCGFAQLQPDCHSTQMSAEESMPTGMAMNGMAMPGTNDADSGGRQLVSAPSHAETRHAVVGEMGPCERQSCDQGQAVAAKANQPGAEQFQAIFIVAGFPSASSLQATFHDARDDLVFRSHSIHSPLSISLRI